MAADRSTPNSQRLVHPFRRQSLLAVLCLGASLAPAATAQSQPASPQAPVQAGPARVETGLVTIESDLQRADQTTGVVTATGNVRIVYPDHRVLATARQAQYFSREGLVVLSGDVDLIQEGGNVMRAERVTYQVDRERLVAHPTPGRQVFSQMRLQLSPATVAPQGSAGSQP